MNDELKLSRLNNQLLKKFLDILKIDTEIKFCKDFTENQDPNLRLIEICKNSNSDTYISGVGGKNYLDISLFEKNTENKMTALARSIDSKTGWIEVHEMQAVRDVCHHADWVFEHRQLEEDLPEVIPSVIELLGMALLCPSSST